MSMIISPYVIRQLLFLLLSLLYCCFFSESTSIAQGHMDEMTQKMTILLCQGGVFIDPLSEENRDHFDEPPSLELCGEQLETQAGEWDRHLDVRPGDTTDWFITHRCKLRVCLNEMVTTSGVR